MDITFYLNHSENHKIKKALTNATTLSGFMRDKVDLLRPTFTITTDIRPFNYCYIGQFNRYYFIDGIENIRTGLWNVKCSVDVLRTYQTEILNLYAIVDKQEGIGNNFLDDGSWVLENRKFNEVHNFTSGFLETPVNILITAGSTGI